MRVYGLLGFAVLLLHSTLAASTQQQAPREVTQQGVTAMVAHIRATQSDLAAFQLVNRESGAVMRVYYEPELRQLAAGHLPYLAWMIDQVARRTQADPGQVIWHSIVFTKNPDYVAPRAGNDTRWTVVAEADATLSPRSQEMLFGVIPHEQVHAVQNSMHPRMPRWFGEGQATWIGLQISGQIRPDYVVQERRKHKESLDKVTAPLSLAAWGGLRPRREAIYRQVSAEDKARMDRDPNFTPSGSFKFGPGDIVAEEVDQAPRYAASLRLFDQLEEEAGAEAMARWQRAVWADAGPIDTARLDALAGEHLKRGVQKRLR